MEDITYYATKWVAIINVYASFIGLVGNVTACIVILSSPSFHTLTGFYLLSISTADLLMLFTGILYNFITTKIPFFNNLGGTADLIDKWLFQTSLIVSTLTVTVFTVERYLAICHPFFVRSIVTNSRVKKIIAAIWLISVLLALLPTAADYISNHVDNEDLLRKNDAAFKYLVDVWTALFFFMPMSVMMVMYVLIWLKLKTSPNGKQTGQADRADTRTLTMFVVIVAVYFISWAPYYIVVLLNSHFVRPKYFSLPDNDDTRIFLYEYHLADIAREAVYPLSFVLNPVIYSMMSRKFREAFKDLLSKVNRKLFDRKLKISLNGKQIGQADRADTGTL